MTAVLPVLFIQLSTYDPYICMEPAVAGYKEIISREIDGC